MIRHIPSDHPALTETPGHPLLTTAIASRAACPQEGLDFWSLTAEGGAETLCVLCRNGDTLYITGGAGHGAALAEFTKRTGISRIMTDLPLPLERRTPMSAMVWGGTTPEISAEPILCCDQTQQPFSAVDFARLQLRCGVFDCTTEADCYAVRLSHALRHGGAAAFALRVDGQLAAGVALRCTATHAILEAVAVLPALRHRGLGTGITTAAAHWALERNKIPLLCCTPLLTPFYWAVGFVPMEPIWQYGKETE